MHTIKCTCVQYKRGSRDLTEQFSLNLNENLFNSCDEKKETLLLAERLFVKLAAVLGSLIKKTFVNLRWDRKNGNAVSLTLKGVRALEELAKL